MFPPGELLFLTHLRVKLERSRKELTVAHSARDRPGVHQAHCRSARFFLSASNFRIASRVPRTLTSDSDKSLVQSQAWPALHPPAWGDPSTLRSPCSQNSVQIPFLHTFSYFLLCLSVRRFSFVRASKRNIDT